jgi:hypothetical protein
MKTTRRLLAQPVLLALLLVLVPGRAEAYELSSGVSLGWLHAGTVPHVAVATRWALSWRTQSDFLLSVHNLCNILAPSRRQDIGVYNQTAVDIGYAWKDGNISAGPSIAMYAMTTCGRALCGYLDGVAVGGQVQANLYITGQVGLSVVAEVDWIAGNSLVIPGGIAATVAVGPVVRWSDR